MSVFFCGHDVHHESLPGTRGGRTRRLGVGGWGGFDTADPEVNGSPFAGESQAPGNIYHLSDDVVVEAPAFEKWTLFIHRASPLPEVPDHVVGPRGGDPPEEEREHRDSAPGGTSAAVGLCAVCGRVAPWLHECSSTRDGFPFFFAGQVSAQPLAVTA